MLHHGGGATLTEVLGPALPPEDWGKVRSAAQRLLRARGDKTAATVLGEYPFELRQGTNYFQDEFAVLYAQLPLNQYAAIGELHATPAGKADFRRIAETISEVGPYTRFVAAVLDTDERPIPVAPPSPKITSQAVERALADAEELIRSRGAASALDRVHTALHGYLRAVGERAGLTVATDASATDILKQLRENHPAIAALASRSEDTRRILMAMATTVDALTVLRNRASGAHPNEQVLEEPEAMLAINAARSLLHYLDEGLAQ